MHLLSSIRLLSVYEVASTRGAPFAYPALARYRAAVYFPWDYGMLLFSELYNVGVPCWIPAVGWQTHLMQRMIRSHSLSYTNLNLHGDYLFALRAACFLKRALANCHDLFVFFCPRLGC